MKYAAIVIVLILIFLFYKKKSIASLPENQGSGDGVVDDVVLRYGSSGLDVRRLQMKLNEKINYAVNEEILVSYSLDGINYMPIVKPLTVDGIFGRATETVLFAMTGKNTIKASEIDNLSIAPAA